MPGINNLRQEGFIVFMVSEVLVHNVSSTDSGSMAKQNIRVAGAYDTGYLLYGE
jgi:hypothetical protein